MADGGGGGFDPCECIWNHENAMQRLMNLVSADLQSSDKAESTTDCMEFFLKIFRISDLF